MSFLIICEFCDDYFHITNDFKDKEHKEGTENKLSLTLQQSLTNVNNFMILASFIDLFIFETDHDS